MTLDKARLRAHARDVRGHIELDAADPEAAARLFFKTLKPKGDTIIAAYWPMGREFDVRPIIDDAATAGISIALPVCGEGQGVPLRFARWDEKTTLAPNRYGVPEPQGSDFVDPDIVIVPFLAFDRRGYRLGQGGGHYDATLADLRSRKPITAVGIGYGAQAVLFHLPIEAHDQKLDLVITPQDIFDYRE